MAKVDNEIKGRLALVTGASGGIGAACARDLWQQGASLALTCYKNRATADVLAQELSVQDQSRKISVHVANMGSAADLEQLILDLETEHGQSGPDILIANAGYGRRIPNILDIPLDEFEYTLRINLQAPFMLAKLSLPHMLRHQWGRVVFVSSIAAIGGGSMGVTVSFLTALLWNIPEGYIKIVVILLLTQKKKTIDAASKAGLTGMMKNLANKHAHVGITFNDVAPAMIGETGLIPDEKTVEGTAGDVKNIPVGRLGVPQECANVVTMLCKTGYMTGQSILLSGGLK
ncbi:hypothetical protein PG993_001691 [Apiospora rasikravindrae]|uniref:Uncharacterized protein n=1 Tax=Apiospora rasikravindrae TaxID=990691 RepID=A0ABR1UF05_9PEZI